MCMKPKEEAGFHAAASAGPAGEETSIACSSDCSQKARNPGFQVKSLDFLRQTWIS